MKLKEAENAKNAAEELAKKGFCTRNLEEVLQSIRVQRQAYYSGAFVGNHIHRCCEVIKA